MIVVLLMKENRRSRRYVEMLLFAALMSFNISIQSLNNVFSVAVMEDKKKKYSPPV